MQRAKLVRIDQTQQDHVPANLTIPLQANREWVLGRSSEAGFQIKTHDISRRHARLFPQNNQWLIEDLGSKNGVTVNGSKITQAVVLQEGDAVGIGKLQFQYATEVTGDTRPRFSAVGSASPADSTVQTKIPLGSASRATTAPAKNNTVLIIVVVVLVVLLGAAGAYIFLEQQGESDTEIVAATEMQETVTAETTSEQESLEQKLQQELSKPADQEAQQRAAEAARVAAEQEAARVAKLEQQKQAVLLEQQQAEDARRQQAELEAKKRAEEEASRLAEQVAKQQAELAAQKQAELAARQQAEEEARKQAELDAKLKAKRVLTFIQTS